MTEMERELDALQNLVNAGTTFVVSYGFQILGAVIILIVGLQLAKWTGGLVQRLCERKSVDVTLARFFANITRVLVLGFTVMIAMGKFGITIAPFIAALSAIAFGASLAVQGPISNFGAGISIILGRPFVVGNTISVRGVTGVVEEVKLAATILSTEDGELITIPNRQIVGEILVNSFENKVVEARIAISYGDDPAHAITVIRDALGRFEEVTANPAPQIGIAAFGESAIDIGLRYWVPTKRYFQTLYAVNRGVYDALREAGISIPCPKLELHVQGGAAAGRG